MASTFLGANLTDKFIVKLNPVIFGSGIPLFSKGIEQTVLKLIENKVYNSGHIVLYYQMKR